MSWTEWRKIATKSDWFPDFADWEGPACYELAIAYSDGSNLKPVYVGETANEKARICQYAQNGSHLAEEIDWHLEEGWDLFYRGYAFETKEEAVGLQDQLLNKYDYDWNIQQNT